MEAVFGAIGFVGGLLLGGIIGVAVERAWQRVERTPRIGVTGGYFINIKRDEGIVFTIKNSGQHDLPPYRLCIFGPTIGSYFFFPPRDLDSKDNVAPALGPDQEEKFEFVVKRNGRFDPLIDPSYAHAPNGQKWFESGDTQVAFRIVLGKSERVLYENKPIGQAFCRILADSVVTGTFGTDGGGWWELVARPPSFIERFKSAFRAGKSNAKSQESTTDSTLSASKRATQS